MYKIHFKSYWIAMTVVALAILLVSTGNSIERKSITPTMNQPTPNDDTNDQSNDLGTASLIWQLTSQYDSIRRISKRLQDTLELRALTSTLAINEDLEPINTLFLKCILIRWIPTVRKWFGCVLALSNCSMSLSKKGSSIEITVNTAS